MKISLIYSILLPLLFFFISCKKLKRDNPLDGRSDAAVNSGSIKFSKYELLSENNGDGLVSKGENVSIQMYLKNISSKRVNKVKASISCSSSFISALNPISATYIRTYGNDYLDAGEEAGSKIGFSVSDITPSGTVLVFELLITDGDNNTWTDTFTIKVVSTAASIGFSRYELLSENNGDQKINKGEAVKLRVYLKNKGGGKANKVRATISCSNSYVSALTPLTSTYYTTYGNDYILPGEEPGSDLNFSIANTTPNGTILTFSLSIKDESNNTWTETFTVAVVPTNAIIAFSRYEITSDNNANGQINPGETIKLVTYLKNTGSSKTIKVRGLISCSSSYISSLTPGITVPYTTTYDAIEPASEARPSTANCPGFTVAGNTPVGTVINFNITATDESDNTWPVAFSITVN